MKKLARQRSAPASFPRVQPDPQTGLSQAQVDLRVEAGAVNAQEQGLTLSTGRIVAKNALTLFNVINLFLAIVVIWVGHPENTLFFGVVICNTAMGIFQEMKAKKTLDELSVLAQAHASVVREGQTLSISQDDIVLDDIVLLAAGDQVCADAVAVDCVGLELDESLLTGETDRIKKTRGDTVLSGSYVTAGQATVLVTAVGADNYANALAAEAKKAKKARSKLLYTLNMIIRVLTVIIIPIGILLFSSQYDGNPDQLENAVLGTTASMTGMIPGGLVLLTGVTLMVGAMNLAQKKALVQSLPSIETLARVDVLCLDKTGTITDGNLVFEELVPQALLAGGQAEKAVSELMGALPDQNATAKCLRGHFGQTQEWQAYACVPFTSDRKWSGVTFHGVGTYLMGAPGVIFAGQSLPFFGQVNRYANEGFRVLCLAYTRQALTEDRLPGELSCVALLVLSDSIRRDAPDTFRYFAQEGVTLKVISGDNPRTVGAVARKAGLEGAQRIIDMSTLPEGDDFAGIVEEYTVFGHVTPHQKRKLIGAMQRGGHTACMTGDGVNDILAMREADCSVAMVGGSSAARAACDFVLLSPTFGAMVNVLKEGRRVINNIERVACLYLVNTIFSMLLALIYTFLPLAYPYAPLQMTPINAFTVGIPSFFLALQPNYDRPKGKLLVNVFEHALPTALTIVFNTLYLQLAAMLFGLTAPELSTMVVFLVGVVGFYLLLRIAQPYTRAVKVMLGVLISGFVLLFALISALPRLQELFMMSSLFSRNAFFYLPLLYFSYHIHGFLGRVCRRGREALEAWRERRARYK